MSEYQKLCNRTTWPVPDLGRIGNLAEDLRCAARAVETERTAAKARWNAQADAYNQWDSLGQDEKDALIAKEADNQRASQCPAAEAPRE